MNLGQLFLNLSFGLYLILYIPQIMHNARWKKFSHMSLSMHLMILQAYACDLCYGLSHLLPWQYLFVSAMGLFFLTFQHGQWYQFKRQKAEPRSLVFLGLCPLILVWPWLVNHFLSLNWQLQINGWISRIFFMMHFLPQIIRNHQKKTGADVINLNYLVLSILLSIMDLFAAYLLNWGLFNLLGGISSLGLKLMLCQQIFNQGKSKVLWKTLSAR